MQVRKNKKTAQPHTGNQLHVHAAVLNTGGASCASAMIFMIVEFSFLKIMIIPSPRCISYSRHFGRLAILREIAILVKIAILVEIAIMRDMAILGDLAILIEMAILGEMAILVEMVIMAQFRLNRCLHAKKRAISYRTVLSRASGMPWGSRFDLG